MVIARRRNPHGVVRVMPYQLKPQRSATLIAALLVLLAVVGGITASRAFA